jgi:hypothetical protein
MNTTNDLQILRTEPHRFTWGRIIKIHDIGDSYAIVEYEPDGFRLYDTGVSPARLFSVYLNGKSLSYDSKTFNGALIVAIAANEGGREKNSQYLLNMADAAMKVLGVPLDEDEV